MKTLISWVGWADFKKTKVDENKFINKVSSTSPNFDIHKKSGLSFNKHILLSTAASEDKDNAIHVDAMRLYSKLSKSFTNCTIEIRFMNIDDAYNLEEITPIAESVLDDFRTDSLYILFSMGTSIMSIAWFNLYERKPYRIKMIFGRDPTHLKSGKLQFEEVSLKYLAPGIQKVQQGKFSGKPRIKIPASLEPIYLNAKKAASYDNISILILGESGTGKEELSKFIQQNSPRADKDFIVVNCSAIDDNLLESRLFGHTKGAFTDAKEEKKGFFEEANGGTIFLDEIGDISPKMQQSLLRVLQEKKILRVGSSKEIEVDVRVISATNKNLLDKVKQGTFREDLYYRINDVSFRLPSLVHIAIQERKELIDHFITETSTVFKKKLKFDKDAKDLLYNYTYPGNIRQLQSLVKNIFIFNDDRVNKENLPAEILTQTTYKNPVLLSEVKKQHIQNIYKLYGQKKPAARALGIDLLTLKRYINDDT